MASVLLLMLIFAFGIGLPSGLWAGKRKARIQEEEYIKWSKRT